MARSSRKRPCIQTIIKKRSPESVFLKALCACMMCYMFVPHAHVALFFFSSSLLWAFEKKNKKTWGPLVQIILYTHFCKCWRRNGSSITNVLVAQMCTRFTLLPYINPLLPTISICRLQKCFQCEVCNASMAVDVRGRECVLALPGVSIAVKIGYCMLF